MTTGYETRNMAIVHEVVLPIEKAHRLLDAHDGFDVDAIAEEVLGTAEQGYVRVVDEARFWDVVKAHEL